MRHGHTVTALDVQQSRFSTAAIDAVFRNDHKCGIKLVTDFGYSIKVSPWHPVWSFCDGVFNYRNSTEIKSLVESGKRVWLPLVKGAAWRDFDCLVLNFMSVDKREHRVAATHDRIAAIVEAGECSNVSQIAAAAKTQVRAVRSFFNERKKIKQHHLTLNQSLAYLIGILIGDGCMTETCLSKSCVLFSTADSEIVEAVREILKEHFPDHTLNKSGPYGWKIASLSLIALVRHLHLGVHFFNKRIPDCLIESPEPVLKALLQGLFDTDGMGRLGTASFASTSESLACDVHQILLAFGIESSRTRHENNHRGYWKVGIYGQNARLFYKTVGFRLLRKQAKGAVTIKYLQEPMDYPPEIRTEVRRAYLSRHSRGAPRGTIPRGSGKSSAGLYCKSSGRSVSSEKLRRLMAFSLSQDDEVLNRYFLEGKVAWEAVVSATPCQVNLYDLSVPRFHNFIGNGFVNHNSWSALHRIARHLWETPNARVAMFSRVLKNSKDAGAWKNLENYTLKEWIQSGIGMRFTTRNYDDKVGPKVDGTTRTPFFRVTNLHGGESECMLFSLLNDNDAESILKEREFSLIYFSELSNFYTRAVLSLGLMCLRMPYLDFKQQMWLADTNPSDEGENSWIYEAFYIEPKLTYEEYRDRQVKLGRPAMGEATFLNFKQNTRVIEMQAEDNERLKPGQLEELKGTYSYDPGLYARFVEGKWVYGSGETSLHFRRFFKPNIHVVGNVDGQDEDAWEFANPTNNCYELITGWDTGETNHAAVIIERQNYTQYLPKTKTTISRAHFTVIDELVSLHTEMSLEEFTNNFMDLIADLEEQAGRKFDLSKAYSDLSAVTMYSATADTFPAVQINAVSLGRIVLIGVPKPRGTMMARVQLLQQLLAFDRIKVSAHCHYTIKMLNDLKKGRAPVGNPSSRINFVAAGQDSKHIFDAVSYALLMELADELEAIPRFATGARAGLAVCVR